MKPIRTEMKDEFEAVRGELQTLRDRIRVKIHLAGMDARDTWEKIEKEVASASHEASQASHATMKNLVARLKKLSDSISHDASPVV